MRGVAFLMDKPYAMSYGEPSEVIAMRGIYDKP